MSSLEGAISSPPWNKSPAPNMTDFQEEIDRLRKENEDLHQDVRVHIVRPFLLCSVV